MINKRTILDTVFTVKLETILIVAWFVWAIGGFLFVPNAREVLFAPETNTVTWFVGVVSSYIAYWAIREELKSGLLLALRSILSVAAFLAVWGLVFYVGSVYLALNLPGFMVFAAAPITVGVLIAAVLGFLDDMKWSRGYPLLESIKYGVSQFWQRLFTTLVRMTVIAAYFTWAGFCWWFFMDFVDMPRTIAKIATGATLLCNGWLGYFLIERLMDSD